MMYEFTDRIMQNITVPEIIIFFICLCVFLISMAALITNLVDWVVNVYFYAKLGWFQLSYPNFKDKIVKMQYLHYIVGEKTGEIFYIDEKKLKKLKKKELIHWDNNINCYLFRDHEVEEIKETISPLIKLHEQK